MSRSFRAMEEYVRLLHRAGFSRYEELRGVPPQEIHWRLVQANRQEGTFLDLPSPTVVEHLLDRALTGYEGRILTADLAGDDDYPFWGTARLRSYPEEAADAEAGMGGDDDFPFWGETGAEGGGE